MAVFAMAFVLLCGTELVNAQQSAADQSPSAARHNRNDDQPNFGWLGLLGLAGFAGLIGRRREYGRDTVRTTGRGEQAVCYQA